MTKADLGFRKGPGAAGRGRGKCGREDKQSLIQAGEVGGSSGLGVGTAGGILTSVLSVK